MRSRGVLGEKSGLLWKNGGFCGFNGKISGYTGVWLKSGVLVKKGRFPGEIRVLVKNSGFFGKWGFRGFLVFKSRKSRKEPGI